MSTEVVVDDPAAVEGRFLAELRGRVAWQSEQAALLRAAALAPPTLIDVLDPVDLDRLLAAHPDAPRSAEWRSFVGELRTLTEEDGRLPAGLERLVRVVLSDIL